MRKRVTPLAGALLAAAVAVGASACGAGPSSSSGASGSGSGTNGGTITIDAGTAPQSADPALDFTTQGNELYSVVNTGLLTFKRGVAGAAGAQLIPGLAKSMPTVTNGGKTYTFTLRPGLKYSNGQPVKASDVPYEVERALKIPWQDAGIITQANIIGVSQYANGKAKSISGIKADDAKGTVTINLSAPYSALNDIFALPGLAPVPQSTPMSNQASTGVVGDGPYKWGPITPNHSYTLVKNTKFDVPGLATGHADKIVYNVNSNVEANAQAVLNNQADVFDPGDTLPASVLQQVQQQTSRYKAVPTNSTFYFWFGVTQKPFNNQDAREAVLAALDDRAISRLDSGNLQEDCHLLPPGIPGGSGPASCPFHNPDGPPNMTLAKQLMQKSGMIGQKVTVYGEERSPRKQYLDYYTQVLNSLGFKATEKVLNSSQYFTTIGAPSLKPQTGFGDWSQDYPLPVDFMQLFSGNAGSQLNYGYVNDSHYNSTFNSLSQQQPTGSVISQWTALDNYAVSKAYYAAYGHEKYPQFYSNKLVFTPNAFSVEYLTDLTALQLK